MRASDAIQALPGGAAADERELATWSEVFRRIRDRQYGGWLWYARAGSTIPGDHGNPRADRRRDP